MSQEEHQAEWRKIRAEQVKKTPVVWRGQALGSKLAISYVERIVCGQKVRVKRFDYVLPSRSGSDGPAEAESGNPVSSGSANPSSRPLGAPRRVIAA